MMKANPLDHAPHRSIVGGLWGEIGELQFKFMVKQGLNPESVLLDIGCGCLRGGVHFIRFLNSGNYYGIDNDQYLLDAGYFRELESVGLRERMPQENLICNSMFDFSLISAKPDFAIAQSLFTHLPLNHIRHCLMRLATCMEPGGQLFATIFECPDEEPLDKPYRHNPGTITTSAMRDPYHYRRQDLLFATTETPWEVHCIGPWDHPRGQKMLQFSLGG